MVVAGHNNKLGGLVIFQAVAGSHHPTTVNDDCAAYMHVPNGLLPCLPRELVCDNKGTTLSVDVVMPMSFLLSANYICVMLSILSHRRSEGKAARGTGRRGACSRFAAGEPPTILDKLGMDLPRIPHSTLSVLITGESCLGEDSQYQFDVRFIHCLCLTTAVNLH